jgi:hypothetical protein
MHETDAMGEYDPIGQVVGGILRGYIGDNEDFKYEELAQLCPAGHGEQATLLELEYHPAVQGIGNAEVALHMEPAGQRVQDDCIINRFRFNQTCIGME